MTSFLKDLMERRRKFLEGLDANKDDINLDIFEDFYPDKAHFVFELLQNAEDTGATEATFKLMLNGCWFEHNGTRTFTEADVTAITGIHNSTKTKESDQIGKFGVGFKSVFVYSLTPTIYSGTFSFRISRLVMPEPVPVDGHNERKCTRFWLPFNNPKKPPELAFSEIKEGLKELAETSLLFLKHIESIKWKIGHTRTGEILRVQHSSAHIEVLKYLDGSSTTSHHFLKFDRPVDNLPKQGIAVAFPLDFLPNNLSFVSNKPLCDQLKIVPASPGKVAVFFPAAKETSGLRFHVHAPFVPELSRASIKETDANRPLFVQLAALTAQSLHHVRDLGLLSAEFLGVLPNPQDYLGKSYECIRTAVVQAMNDECLTPTNQKAHAPAKYLYQAKASLKDLLSLEDIEFLIEYEEEPPQWAMNRALQGTNPERFMNALSINKWDIDDFIERVDDDAGNGCWGDPDVDFMSWLSAKSMDWHQQLYALLHREQDAHDRLDQLEEAKIIRLVDGTYARGRDCHCSAENVSWSPHIATVDPSVYTLGKSKLQQDYAMKFLLSVGVTEIGEQQLIKAILEQRYKIRKPLNEKEYVSHLWRFIKILTADPSCAAMFAPYLLFLGEDNLWHAPTEIVLDEPYLKTGLKTYYQRVGKRPEPVALAEFYLHLPIDPHTISRFAQDVGAKSSIKLEKARCDKNPDWNYLRMVGGERYTSPEDTDYVFPYFAQIVAPPSVEISRLIWRTMCAAHANGGSRDTVLRARYRRNLSSGEREADSQLVHQLRNAAWVPQNDRFVKPEDAKAEDLSEGFTFDSRAPWIRAINFGAKWQAENPHDELSRRIEMRLKKEAAAKELGFKDAGAAEKALLIIQSDVPLDVVHQFVNRWKQGQAVELPDQEPRNVERRSEGVLADAITAPVRRYEERVRSVAIGQGPIKEEAAQYLKQQYTNPDADLLCQACKTAMPFRLGNGEHYFEVVSLLPRLKKLHKQNYLALCPNHSAMFQHAHDSAEYIQESLAILRENELSVILAGADVTLYFTKTHIADLQTIIMAEQSQGAIAKMNDSGQ